MNKVQELLIKMLKWIDFFQWLSDEEILEFASSFKLNFALPNSVLIREGTIPDKIYVVKNWKLKVQKADALNIIELWEIKPGEIIWEISFFTQKPAIASVIVSKEWADIWEIDKDKFKEFLLKYKWVKEKIETVMRKRLEENKKKWNWKYDNYQTINGEKENDQDLEFSIKL